MSGKRLISVPTEFAPASLSRRGFLGGAAVGVGGALAADMRAVNGLRAEEIAGELRRGEKHVILLWLAGGASQLETWDPKPGVKTGGPFAAIPTNVSGIEVSELLPKLAQRMQMTAVIVRSTRRLRITAAALILWNAAVWMIQACVILIWVLLWRRNLVDLRAQCPIMCRCIPPLKVVAREPAASLEPGMLRCFWLRTCRRRTVHCMKS